MQPWPVPVRTALLPSVQSRSRSPPGQLCNRFHRCPHLDHLTLLNFRKFPILDDLMRLSRRSWRIEGLNWSRAHVPRVRLLDKFCNRLHRRPGPGALRLFSAHQRPPWRYRGPVPTLARSPPWLYARCDRDLFQDGTGDRSPEPTLFPISSDFCRFSAGAACRLSNRPENPMALNGTFGRSGLLYVLEGGTQKSEDRVR